MYTTDYIKKTYDFINSNNIKKINKDPTKDFSTEINDEINKSLNLFTEKTRRYLKQINPQPPQLKALPKIHKQGDFPIRPLVNYTTSPEFKTAKIL